MTSVPHYHQQPATLDDRVEIAEPAPLAQGHDEDRAADVREANAEHKATVEAEADADPVGPREPGDYPTAGPEGPDVPEGTVEEVLDWVGDDPERARRALEAERAGQNRSSLTSKLETIAG